MQPWDEYTTKLPYHSARDIADRLREQIDSERLSKSEREEKLNAVDGMAREFAKDSNKPRDEDEQRLESMFWKDCREDIGYDKYLTEQGVSIVEAKAWQDGHSAGYSEVYGQLLNLDEFLLSLKGEFT